MYQKVVIVGNLGGEPEMKFTPNGDAVTSFSLATNRHWTNNDGSKGEETTWFRISCWGRQAEAVNQYLHKGSQCLVEGRLTPDRETGGPRIWQGNDGQPRASYELRAITVQFLGGGQRSDNGQGQVNPDKPEPDTIAEDEVPF